MDIALDRKIFKTGTLDLGLLAVMYTIPSVAHMVSFPIYMLDPMRILVFILISFTERKNVYLMALTIPLFSFITSGHPVYPKTALVAMELTLNAYFFYRLQNVIPIITVNGVISVLLSKITYYALKLLFIEFSLISGDLISTPLMYQLIPIIIITVMLALLYRQKSG